MSLQIVICMCLVLSAAVTGKIRKIIGGIDTSITDFPYHAALRRISDNEHICGAAIISRRHVVSTAHCVDPKKMNKDNLMICTGVSTESSLSGSSFLPQLIIIHSKYTGNRDPTTNLLYDIAVIMLKEAIDFNEYQNKINLPNKQIASGEIGIVTGWGATSCPPNGFSSTLKRAWMTILDKAHCQRKLKFQLADDQFCGFQKPGVGVCKGDGGSPLSSDYKLIGLVYASRPYATGDPEIYIDVNKHVDFINSFIRD